ncbi:AAA family ATPase [Pseudomonas viridiflava]|uniref:AAA family ATPase n=1 Tax=Pseudomonas viridiflava TaxID=33069 RepID=UPI001C31E7C0|nr:ATP-binding protein [Pseudomonas viridiflava]QXG35517.1 ATP-binding protein [Pseudomonas viridiflava]
MRCLHIFGSNRLRQKNVRGGATSTLRKTPNYVDVAPCWTHIRQNFVEYPLSDAKMLHYLRFSNFYSFLDEVEISFSMDGRSSPNEKSCKSSVDDKRISKIMAVVGANGAGKTNAIKPFAFLTWFISRSFQIEKDQQLYVRPHFLSKSDISVFELEFEISGRLFKYNLSTTHTKVYFEALHEKTSRLWSNLFTREWQEETSSYDIKQRGFGFDSRLAAKTKKNSSLISTAVQHEVEIASMIAEELKKVQSNISSFGRNSFQGFSDVMDVTSFYEKNEDHRVSMKKLLSQWDFGLSDIVIQSFKNVDHEGNEYEYLMPFGVHVHDGKEFQMPLMAESSGTQAAYFLLTKLLPVLSSGGIVIYDELEGDLHPHMLENILELFFNPRSNPHNAQIIFTTHSIEVLNDLQKCQILLVEKSQGVSDAWRLSEMAGVRSDDNFYAKYMSGTYGAVPHL